MNYYKITLHFILMLTIVANALAKPPFCPETGTRPPGCIRKCTYYGFPCGDGDDSIGNGNSTGIDTSIDTEDNGNGSPIDGDDNNDGICSPCEACYTRKQQRCNTITVELKIDEDNQSNYKLPTNWRQCKVAPASQDNTKIKVMSAFTGDADVDGLPDFVDGLNELTQVNSTLESSPLKRTITTNGLEDRLVEVGFIVRGDPGEGSYAIFQYNSPANYNQHLDDENVLACVPYQDQTGIKNTTLCSNSSGPLRLWRDLGSSNTGRSGKGVDQESELSEDQHGDYITPGAAIPLNRLFNGRWSGETKLKLEALYGIGNDEDPSGIMRTITVTVYRANQSCPITSENYVQDKNRDAVFVQPFHVSILDISAYDPTWQQNGDTYGDGELSFQRNFSTSLDGYLSDNHPIGTTYPYSWPRVSGAITDGAAAVRLSVFPKPENWGLQNSSDSQSPFGDVFLRIDRKYNDDALPYGYSDNETAIYGSFFEMFEPDTSGNSYHNRTIPVPLPAPRQDCSGDSCVSPYAIDLTRQLKLTKGIAGYVPPQNFISKISSTVPERLQGNNGPMHFIADEYDDLARMDISILGAGTNNSAKRFGKVIFNLKRPPLALIHGIRVGADSWYDSNGLGVFSELDPNENTAGTIHTRVYRGDWGAYNLKGLDFNFPTVGRIINFAINEYRNGYDYITNNSDSNWSNHLPKRSNYGVNYAAVKVDVFGHSAGGQLARLYMSDISQDGERYTRPRDNITGIWSPFNMRRSVTKSTNGNQAYFRSDNFGAGDIRRFVALGSPFKGSLLGTLASRALAPTSEQISLTLGSVNKIRNDAARILAGMSVINTQQNIIEDIFFELAQDNNRTVLSFRAPDAFNDLSINSSTLLNISKAYYPATDSNGLSKEVPFFPIAGVAANWSLQNGYIRNLTFGENSRLGLDVYNSFANIIFQKTVGRRGATIPPLASLGINPFYGDGVVDAFSQRNLDGPTVGAVEGCVNYNPEDMYGHLRGCGKNVNLGVVIGHHVHSDNQLVQTILDEIRSLGWPDVSLDTAEQQSGLSASLSERFLYSYDRLNRGEKLQEFDELYGATFTLDGDSLK